MTDITRADLRAERELYGPIDGRYFGTSHAPVTDDELRAMGYVKLWTAPHRGEDVYWIECPRCEVGLPLSRLQSHIDFHDKADV